MIEAALERVGLKNGEDGNIFTEFISSDFIKLTN